MATFQLNMFELNLSSNTIEVTRDGKINKPAKCERKTHLVSSFQTRPVQLPQFARHLRPPRITEEKAFGSERGWISQVRIKSERERERKTKRKD